MPVITEGYQLGQSVTPSYNFNLVVPAVPNGTWTLNRGNVGSAISTILSGDASNNVVFGGTITDGSGNQLGYKLVPQNIQSTSYTTVIGDSGFDIFHPTADTTARTFTIPSNGSVPYPIGTVISFTNQHGAGVVTIAVTTDSVYLAGTGLTGNRTLAANGTATYKKVALTEWMCFGIGLT